MYVIVFKNDIYTNLTLYLIDQEDTYQFVTDVKMATPFPDKKSVKHYINTTVAETFHGSLKSVRTIAAEAHHNPVAMTLHKKLNV